MEVVTHALRWLILIAVPRLWLGHRLSRNRRLSYDQPAGVHDGKERRREALGFVASNRIGCPQLPSFISSNRNNAAVTPKSKTSEIATNLRGSFCSGGRTRPFVKNSTQWNSSGTATERAQRAQSNPDTGAVNHRADLARRFNLTRARVTQIMNLLKLEPTVLAYVRSLPPGTPPRLVTERKLRELLRLPANRQVEAARSRIPGFAEAERSARQIPDSRNALTGRPRATRRR